MEARVEGRAPMAVTQHADSVAEALQGASAKMKRSLDKVIDKITDQKGNTPMSGDDYEIMSETDTE